MPEQTDIYISSFPDAESITNADKVTGLQGNVNKNFTFSSILAWFVNAVKSAFVPVSRTINGKTLDTSITLTASDVGARSNTWTPSAADVGAIPTTAAGEPLGIAELDSDGKVPSNQLPAIPSQPSDIGAQPTITESGILKGDGAGGVSAATPGTDYQAPLTAGTDYATPAQLDGKANQAQLAYVETGTTASRNHAVGEYFCWNGLLYLATSAISSGQPFNPGSNCESVTASTAFLTTYPIRIYNTNLDSLDYGGIYQLATGNTNGPTDIGSINWSMMFMFGDGGWNGMQMIFANSHIRYRTRFNRNWSSWSGSF